MSHAAQQALGVARILLRLRTFLFAVGTLGMGHGTHLPFAIYGAPFSIITNRGIVYCAGVVGRAWLDGLLRPTSNGRS